jgi:hypothetical protein
VLEADVRDHRGFWHHDVRRIEPASEADLEHHDVAPGVAKRLEREERRILEEGERGQTIVGTERLDSNRCLALRDWPTSDSNAFDVSLQVRRGELPGMVARSPQDGLDHRRDAALPVRSGDVYVADFALGMPAYLRGGLHSIETELDAT